MLKLIQTKKTALSYSISDSATTIRLENLLKLDGSSVSASDIGDLLTGTFDPGTSREEIFSIDGQYVTVNADGSIDITNVVRGLKEVDPYTTGGFATDHPAGAVVVFGNNPQVYNTKASLVNDNEFEGANNFAELPTSDGGNAIAGNQLITYAQALALLTGGGTINQTILAGTAGETIAKDELVYLKASDGRWWKSDADDASTVENVILGIAQGAGTAGNAITSGVLTYGLATLTAFTVTANTKYFASNTAGGISTTAGTNQVTVGYALTTSTLFFNPGFDQKLTEDQMAALAGTSGTPSSTNKYVTENDTSNAATLTGTGIAFVASTKTITDSGNGFVTANFRAGSSIIVTGTVSNNGTYTIVSVVAGTITVVETLVDESAGGSFTLTTVKANKVLRLDNNGNLPATSIPTVIGSVTAGENISTQKPVYINYEDSRLYTAHGYKQDSSGSFTYPATEIRQIAKLNDSQFLVLSFSTTTLTVSLFSNAGGAALDSETVSTAFSNLDHTEKRPNATVARISDTKFVVIYTSTNDSVIRYRTGSVSGSAITMDTDSAYPSSPDFCYALAATPTDVDGKIGFVYQDSTARPGNSATVVEKLLLLTVDTNSLTITTSVNNGTYTSGTYNAQPLWTCITYTNGVIYGLFNSVDSGNQYSLTYGAIKTADSSTVIGIKTSGLETPSGAGNPQTCFAAKPSFVGHDGKAYFGFMSSVDTVSQYQIQECSMSGNRVFYTQMTVKGTAEEASGAMIMFGNNSGILVFGLLDGTGQSSFIHTLYIQRGKIFSINKVYTQVSATRYADGFYSNSKDQIVFVEATTVLKVSLPTPFDGFSQSAITSGSAGSLYDSFVTLTGLTANQKYYLKDTYTTAGDIELNGVIPVGNALSTTSLKCE